MGHVTLVLGGARSGKSAYAESLSRQFVGARSYIATAELLDEEMRNRVTCHITQRGEGWQTVEAPVDLVRALIDADAAHRFTLIDCITVWIGNLMHHQLNVGTEVDRFCGALSSVKGDVAIVANEVGLGIVPDNALARQFRDEAGRANQAIAAAADSVVFITAGLPMILKGPRPAPG